MGRARAHAAEARSRDFEVFDREYALVFLLSLSFQALPVYKTLKLSRISVSLNLDSADGVVNGRQVLRCQFYRCSAKILL
jgi:hypothetical protein